MVPLKIHPTPETPVLVLCNLGEHIQSPSKKRITVYSTISHTTNYGSPAAYMKKVQYLGIISTDIAEIKEQKGRMLQGEKEIGTKQADGQC